jgi:ATP-dependent RNA helicase DDX27
MQAPKRTPYSGMSRKEKRRKMAAEEDREDQDAGTKSSINASIRSVKKLARAPKMTVAPPPRVAGKDRSKPKKGKGGFDKELGQAGRAEREKERVASGEKPMRPSPMQRKKVLGGSAGKGKQNGSDKRAGKSSKRS